MTFPSFHPSVVAVVGDFMLDLYTHGRVQRVSPEAPVLVLSVDKESHHRPGGAGNAALNMVAMGMKVKAIGRVGGDETGNLFLKAFAEEGIDISGILQDHSFRTPLKNRMIADNQQLLRVDYEQALPLSKEGEEKIIRDLPNLLKGVSAIALSDYGKGFLTRPLLAHVISWAKSHAIPVIVDPKGSDFSKYSGATLLKPNLGEVRQAAALGEEASLDSIAEKIFSLCDVGTLMVTKSKEGISLFTRSEKRRDFPALVREVRDVTGAGDTVLAVITAAYACHIDLPLATRLANTAAGIAIERFGCARVSLAELKQRWQEIQF